MSQNEILVMPKQLREKAAHLEESAKTIQACVDDIDQHIRALGPEQFSGHSADEFRRRYMQLKERISKFKPLVDSFANELTTAAGRFEIADRSLNQ